MPSHFSNKPKHLKNLLVKHISYAPQPNYRFNADANIGHRSAILMANVGALRPSAYGAG